MRAGSQIRVLPSEEHVDLAVEVFRMLADGTRVRLLWLLAEGEMTVSELAVAADKTPTGVSQHLAKLRLGRLVSTRREGHHIYYRIDSDHVRQLVIDAVHNAEHADSGVPEHHRHRDAGEDRDATITPLEQPQ